MLVMKFGGTSVENAAAINRMISIVRGRLASTPVIVVSAFSKVTDGLYRICEFLEANNAAEAKRVVEELRTRHVLTLQELFSGPEPASENHTDIKLYSETYTKINAVFDELSKLADVVCALEELSDRSRARIISTGEFLSSTIIAAALNNASIRTAWVDAKQMMITDGNYLSARPMMKIISEKVPEVISAALKGNEAVITQGFVSSSTNGLTTVLGRGGSDYTASILGSSLGVREIEIWTDVDGIFSADPRTVAGTKSLRTISFEEATEMAHFGAKVLHPSTILPAIEKNIPVRVLNSRNPRNEGTLIVQNSRIPDGIKSVSFKENITVINIFSTTMINTFGFLEKVFEIFSRNKVSVDLISTSEANVSLTLEPGQDIREVVEELSRFSEITVEDDKSQISVIGKNLIGIRGLCTKVFSSLKDYKIHMISQGASAINLSFVVDRESLSEIVNRLHNKLFEDESSN